MFTSFDMSLYDCGKLRMINYDAAFGIELNVLDPPMFGHLFQFGLSFCEWF